MKKWKAVLAVFLIAAVVTVSGADVVRADSLFSRLFGSAGSNSADSTGKSKSSDLIVVLDAGHGGYDSGAVGNGLYEKNLNLKIAKYCKAELEKYAGVKVYMTRSTDHFVALDQRVSIAAGHKADVFVSLHNNSAANSAASGTEVYYPNYNYRPSIGEKGRKLAGEIQKSLNSLGLSVCNNGIKSLDSKTGTRYPDGSLADFYAVIRGSKQSGFPGIIVEHAFISSASDASKYLNSDTKLKKLGVADAKGIASCYGLKKVEETETLQPTELTRVIGKSSNLVSLKWDKVKGVTGYEIFRSTSKNGTYKQIATVKKAKNVTYKDKGVKAGKAYFYKVRPYKISGNKKEVAPLSPEQKVKLLSRPKIAVSKKTGSMVNVKWKQVKGALKYEVYRSTSKKGKYQMIATVQEIYNYKDITRKAGKTYYYKVRAVSNGIGGTTYRAYSEIKGK